MGLFDRKEEEKPPAPTAAEVATTGKEEPDNVRTTPNTVPPVSSIPDGTDVTKGVLDSRPPVEPDPPARAEAIAKSNGLYCTDDRTIVQRLTALNIQPMHVEGARASRPHKMFVYNMTPEKAKEMLNGG